MVRVSERRLALFLPLLLFLSGIEPCSATEKAADEASVAPQKGQLRIVKAVEVRGTYRIRDAYVLGLLRSQVGKPFYQKEWDRDWCRVVRSGFFYQVRVSPALKADGGVRLVIQVIENPVIKRLHIRGVEEEALSDLKNGLACKEGRLFDARTVCADQTRIRDQLSTTGKSARVALRIPELSNLRAQEPDDESFPREVTVEFIVSWSGEETKLKQPDLPMLLLSRLADEILKRP